MHPDICQGEELEEAVWEHVKGLMSDPGRLLEQFEDFASHASRGKRRRRRGERLRAT